MAEAEVDYRVYWGDLPDDPAPTQTHKIQADLAPPYDEIAELLVEEALDAARDSDAEPDTREAA